MVAVREADEESRDRVRRDRVVLDASVVHVHLVLDGMPRIVASRGASRFMVMMFDTTLEARRVLDWVRWRMDALQNWFLTAQTRETAALEQFILDSMLADEGRVKAAGLAAGGQRPLRHWRPRGAGRDGPDGSDPGDDGLRRLTTSSAFVRSVSRDS